MYYIDTLKQELSTDEHNLLVKKTVVDRLLCLLSLVSLLIMIIGSLLRYTDSLNSFDTEALFSELDLTRTKGIVSSKIYDKWDDFNFEIVNFPDGNVPRFISYGVNISQLIYFARV